MYQSICNLQSRKLYSHPKFIRHLATTPSPLENTADFEVQKQLFSSNSKNFAKHLEHMYISQIHQMDLLYKTRALRSMSVSICHILGRIWKKKFFFELCSYFSIYIHQATFFGPNVSKKSKNKKFLKHLENICRALNPPFRPNSHITITYIHVSIDLQPPESKTLFSSKIYTTFGNHSFPPWKYCWFWGTKTAFFF